MIFRVLEKNMKRSAFLKLVSFRQFCIRSCWEGAGVGTNLELGEGNNKRPTDKPNVNSETSIKERFETSQELQKLPYTSVVESHV